LLNT